MCTPASSLSIRMVRPASRKCCRVIALYRECGTSKRVLIPRNSGWCGATTRWLYTPHCLRGSGTRSMPCRYFISACVERQEQSTDVTFSLAQPMTSVSSW